MENHFEHTQCALPKHYSTVQRLSLHDYSRQHHDHIWALMAEVQHAVWQAV